MTVGDPVLITRDSADEKPARRVYITGPHFGDTGIFSSTDDWAKATRYQRWQAERFILKHHWRNARIEDDQ